MRNGCGRGLIPLTTPDSGAVFHTEWVAALERMERDLGTAERLAADPEKYAASELPMWQPPVIPGPMPAYLADRARQLVERQRSAMAALHGRAQLLRQEAAFTTNGTFAQVGHETSIVDIHA